MSQNRFMATADHADDRSNSLGATCRDPTAEPKRHSLAPNNAKELQAMKMHCCRKESEAAFLSVPLR